MNSKDIIRELIENILSNELPKNTKLPSELSLSKKYECNRHTIRKAIEGLIERGYLRKAHRGATYINDIPSQYALSLCSLFDLYPAKDIKTTIIKFEKIIPTQVIADKLQIDSSNKVWSLVRARYIMNNPSIIEYTYMPVSFIPNLSYSICEASILYYIENELHCEISHGLKTIKATELNQFELNIINCKDTTKALEVENIGFLTTGRVYEYSISKHLQNSITYYAKRI